MDHVPVNWFDFVAVIIILLGLSKGRKNGMSVELLPMLQWLAIIFAGAFLYQPLGDILRRSTPGVNRVFAYTSAYIVVAIVVKLVFSGFKKAVGAKIMEANVFGRGEFYLGMIAGAVRFACVMIAALALMNAPYYSAQEVARNKAAQIDLYGSNFFPGVGVAQHQIFKESMLGSALKEYAGIMLVASIPGDKSGASARKDKLPDHH